MRILIFNWRDGRHPAAGGAEVYTEQVIRRWAKDGHDVTLFSAAVDGEPREVAADQDPDGIHRVRAGSRFGVYRAAPAWYRKHGVGRYDLVIDEVNTRPFFCHEWVEDAPVVALYHQTCEEIWNHQMPFPLSTLGRHVLEPRWLARMTGVPAMAVSRSTADAIARFGVDGARIVPEGLEPAVAPSVPKATVPTLIHCGRLVSYKQVDHILQAVEIARRDLPELRLWIVGSGPEQAALEKRAPAGVEFCGFVPLQEKLERMAAATAIVMASTREGWGLVIAEAAVLGTRAIAYDRPGLRDAVSAAGGVLTPPNPEALAAWIVQTLPQWMEQPPAPVPNGGVHPWDAVAEHVFATATELAGLTATSTAEEADRVAA